MLAPRDPRIGNGVDTTSLGSSATGGTVALGSTTEVEDDTGGGTVNAEEATTAEEAAEGTVESTLEGALLTAGAPEDNATRH